MEKVSKKDLQQYCDDLLSNPQISSDDIQKVKKIQAFLLSQPYGLVFEEHEENVDIEARDNYLGFLEFKDKEIVGLDKNQPYNFLLEGDNLHSLRLLEKTHKNRIDVIYIDPPYNTGNEDFTYNDKIANKSDAFYHSQWLSFMKERLMIAYRLLKDDGLIFISIDDEELYNLKLLCDQVFDDGKGFVANICVELSKTQGMKVKSAQNGGIVKNHEYILVYAKNINSAITNRCVLYDKTEPWDEHFSTVLIPNGDGYYEKQKLGDYIKEKHPEIIEQMVDYKLIKSKDSKITSDVIYDAILSGEAFRNFFYEAIADKVYQDMACDISIDDENVIKELKDGKVLDYKKYILRATDTGTIRQYGCLKNTINMSDEYEPEVCRTTIRGALWKGFYSDMMNVAKEGNTEFKNGKKPKRLIKQILKYTNRPNGIVLDFFAGSGTTGQAVLELNKEDGGNRQFILCTNNEISARFELKYLKDNGYLSDYKPDNKVKNSTIKKKINKFYEEHPDVKQYLLVEREKDFQSYGICQAITYKRISTVINGYSTKEEVVNPMPTNLKYFKANTIAKEPRETLEYRLCEEIECLIELESHLAVDNEYIKILWNSSDIDNLIHSDNSNLKVLYFEKDELEMDGYQTIFIEELQQSGVQIRDIPKYYYKES